MTPEKMKTIVGIYDEPVRVDKCSFEWTLQRPNGWIDFKTDDDWGFTIIIRSHYNDDPCRPDVSVHYGGNRGKRQSGVVRIHNRLLKTLLNDKKITFKKG